MGKIIHPAYFPFPSFCGASLVDCNTPSTTLSQKMYEYWVAKTYRVKISMSDNGGAQPPNPEYNFYYGIDAGSEEVIPCTGVFSFIYQYGDRTQNEFDTNTFFNRVNHNQLCSYIAGLVTRFSEANDDFLYFGDLQGLQQTGTAVISFGDGHSLSIPYAILSQQPGANPDLFFEFITSFDISVVEYWSYGGTYDTTTGTRL